MKKELFAVVLLAAILALSLWNTHEIKNICGELTSLVESSGHAAESGDWEASRECAEKAIGLWKSREGYTHIVLRHSDIETLSDDFFELMEHISARDSGTVQSAVRLVTEHLRGITDMESLKLGSIF